MKIKYLIAIDDRNEGYKGVSDGKWYIYKIYDRWVEWIRVVCKESWNIIPNHLSKILSSKVSVGSGMGNDGSIITLCTEGEVFDYAGERR